MHDAALSFLSKVSPTLRMVTFNLWALSQIQSSHGLQNDLAGTMDWARLVSVLSAFPLLRAVRFVNMFEGDPLELEEYKDFVVSNLPRMYAHGLLEFGKSMRHPYTF